MNSSLPTKAGSVQKQPLISGGMSCGYRREA
jgi:hypothetical protein